MSPPFPSRIPFSLLLPSLTLLLLPLQTQAYTWAFQNTPSQCGNITIQVSGGGTPPYRVLIVPFGPTPLPNNIEARKIMDIPFGGNANNVTFQLKYPENSQFVAVISDSTGFGSGGTSVAAQVTQSSDASCFDAKTMVSPQFFFSIEPPNQIVQCQDTRLWWDPAMVQGTPSFVGIIPGGQSFAVPQGAITSIDSQGTGFTWKPSLRGGTTLLLVAGDSRGAGSGGSEPSLVSSGINNDGSCLSAGSPSSTPGSPAGGSYPTSTDGSTTTGGGKSKSKSNIGAIVGGVIGGLALLIGLLLLLWCLRRRSRKQKRTKERPVDLLNADEDDGDERGGGGRRRNELPEYYQPEPFMVPDPTLPGGAAGRVSTETRQVPGSSLGGDHAAGDVEGRRPVSGRTTTQSFYTRTGTPDPSSAQSGSGGASGPPSSWAAGAGGGGAGGGGGRKVAGGGGVMRPVNIIQHDDAGAAQPPHEEEGEPETVELPPAYTAVKKGPGAAGGAAPGGGGGGGTAPPVAAPEEVVV